MAQQENTENMCPACTFVNAPTATTCEVCATPLTQPIVIAPPEEEPKEEEKDEDSKSEKPEDDKQAKWMEQFISHSKERQTREVK